MLPLVSSISPRCVAGAFAVASPRVKYLTVCGLPSSMIVEIVLREIGDEIALLVDGGDAEGHQIDAGAERRACAAVSDSRGDRTRGSKTGRNLGSGRRGPWRPERAWIYARQPAIARRLKVSHRRSPLEGSALALARACPRDPVTVCRTRQSSQAERVKGEAYNQ